MPQTINLDDLYNKKPSDNKQFVKSTEPINLDNLYSGLGDPVSIKTESSQYDTGFVLPEDNTQKALAENRAQRQSSISKLGRGLVNASTGLVFDAVKDASYLFDWEQTANLAKGTETEFSNFISDAMDKAKESTKLDIYRTEDSKGFHPESAGWWADAMPSIASGLSMVIPAQLATKGLGIAGKLMGGKKVLSALGMGTEALEGIAGASISRYMENTLEGAQTFQDTYQKAIDSGATQEIATKTAGEAARKNWMLNSAMVLQDIPQYLLLTKGFKDAGAIFSKEGMKEIGSSIASEAGEEAYQFITDKESRRQSLINNKLTPEDNTDFVDRLIDYSKDGEFWTSAVLGGIGGGIFAAQAVNSNNRSQEQFTGLLSAYKGVLTNDKNTFNRGQDIVFNQAITNAIENKTTDKLKNDIQTISQSPQRIQDTEEKEDILKNSAKILNTIKFAENIQSDIINDSELSPELKKLKFGALLNQRTSEQRLRDVNSTINRLSSEDYGTTNLPSDILEYKKVKLTIEGLKNIPNLQSKVKELETNLNSVKKEILESNKDFKTIGDIEKAIITTNDDELKKALVNKEIESSIIEKSKETLLKLKDNKERESLQSLINERKEKDKKEQESGKQEETEQIPSTPVETETVTETIDLTNTPETEVQKTIIDKIVKGKKLTPEEEQVRQNDPETINTKLKENLSKQQTEEIPLESQNEQKILAKTQIDEPDNYNEVVNTQSKIEENFDLGNRGKKKVSPFTIDAGPDNGSDPNADRYYRFVNKNFIPWAQNLVVTKKNNPKLYNEILELDRTAKDFEDQYFKDNKKQYEGIYIVLGDKHGNILRSDKKGNIDENGKIVFGTVTSTEALGKRIIEKYTNTLPILTKQLEEFRKKALESTEPFYVNTTDKSTGHAVFEKTKNGIRQSHSVIGRIADKLSDIDLQLPTVSGLENSRKGLLKNGQVADIGKLYASTKNNNGIDLIPRLLNQEEQDKVFDLVLQKLGIRERKSQTISEELNRLIYFGIPKTGPTQYTLGQIWGVAGFEKSVIVIGKNKENRETLSTEEGQNRLKEFLKTKRVNVNTKYGFEDQFTDIFGKNHDSYRDYLLSGENPLFGTDLVKNTEVRFRNQYFTYDPTPKEKTLTETTAKKVEKKKFQKKNNKDLDRLKTENSKRFLIPESEKVWFKSNFPNIPLELVKGLIENKSWGRFLASGKVLLSDEATPGTLYHEAFHTVSQLYLTKSELNSLYKETKERTGVKTNLEAEELLAEEFIEYKKSGKIIGGRYVRNDLFRKILNFLKDLLGIPASSIEDIYRRIDKGYYKNKPTNDSIQYKSLDRSKISEDKGVEFEQEVLSNIGALYYDELFTKNLTPTEQSPVISKALSDKIHDKIIDVYEAETDPNIIDNLDYILDNWENIINTFIEKSKSNGIEIRVLKEENKDGFNIDNLGEDSEDIFINKEENKKSKDTAHQEANLESTKDTMSDDVWTLITGLKQKNKDGSDKISEITRLPLAINPTKTYNFLLKQLAGLSTYKEIYDKIDAIAYKKPELIDLLEKLGEPSTTNSYKKQLLQLKFTQNFGKNRATSYKTILKENNTVIIVDANNENNAGRIKEKWQNNIYRDTKLDEDGNIILDLETVQFGDPEVFLKSIGFDLSEEAIKQAKQEDKFIPAVTYLQKYLLKKKGNITTLFTPSKVEKEDNTDTLGNINYLAELEADNNPESAELSFISTENKTVYSIGNNNSISKIKNIINNSSTLDELYQKLPHLNTISTEGSIWLKELFDSNGNKRKDRELEIDLQDGLAADSESDSDFKQSTRKLTAGDKWVQEIHSILLNGKSSFIRASDKSSEHTVSLNKYGKSKKLYLSIDELSSLDSQKLKETFQGYFKSELKRVALFRVLNTGEDLETFGNTLDSKGKQVGNKGSNFTVFESILKNKKPVNEAIETLKSQDLSQEELIAAIDGLVPSFYNQLDQDVIDFFTKYSEEIRNDIKDLGITKKSGISREFSKYSLDQLSNTVAVNDFISSVEQTKLLIGDMAFYKDLFKRTSGFTGTKEQAANDSYINGWLNNNFQRKDGKVENGEIHTVVFEDVNQSLNQELLDNYIDNLLNSGFTKEQAESILKPYKSMDEGDAQGYITLDEYRSFLTRLGIEIPQDIFNKAQKGEILSSDEMYYFTVLKPQYCGPQKYNTIYAPAFHKFSLIPLLPSMVKGTNLEILLDNMTKNEIGYALFKSGSKVGTRVTNGRANKFYTDTNNGEINTENWQKQTVFYDFLGLQTKTSEPKESVIFGTQFRKLLFGNQFEEGKEVIKGSQKLLDDYNDTISKLVEKEKSKLIKDLGINPNDYKSEDVSKIIDLLQKEAKDRNLADNLIDGLQSEIIEGKLLLKYKFDAMVTKTKIDSMLMSLVNSRLIRQKLTGDALIQVSSSGFENKGNRKIGTNEVLRGYTQDKNGKTLPAQVMIPLNGQYKALLDSFGSLEKLNKAIKGNKVPKTELQLVAYRIPTQGFNSMEFFEITEFLPEESSTSIVVPTSIVAKSGSDFDIDKLNVIKRSNNPSQNKIMDIAIGILSDNSNFTSLITPNSSEILKNVANEIRFIEHLNKNPDPELTRDRFESQEAYNQADNAKKDKYISEREIGLKNNIRYTNQLKLSGKEGKIAQFTKFMTAKDMIGITAIQNTHHTLGQTHNLTIDGKQATINLPHNKLESGDISLAKLKDSEGRHLISEIISQVLTASVDAVKDQFMFDINMTMETLPVALFLTRAGVPFETIGYFLAQPIIKEYITELNINKSGFLKVTKNNYSFFIIINKILLKYLSQLGFNYTERPSKNKYNLTIDTKHFIGIKSLVELKKEYKKLAIKNHPDKGGDTKIMQEINNEYEILRDNPSLLNSNTKDALIDSDEQILIGDGDKEHPKFSENYLKQNLSKENQKGNDYFINQIRILRDYLNYKKYSQSLSDAVRATNMDTSGVGKNLNTIQSKLDLIEQVKKDNFVKGINDILEKSIVKTFNQLEFTKQAFGQFYYTQEPEFIKVKQELLKELNPFGDQEKDKLATLIENDLINFIVQNHGFVDIDEYKEQLFKIKPIAKKLLDLKRKQDKNVEEQKIVDNLLVKELQPLIANLKRPSNNIRLYTKKLDSFVSNQLTEAFRELKEFDPELAKEIMDLGILQSGLNNSPITYLGLIPYEYYNDLVKRAFEEFQAKKNGVEELKKFKELFLRENPKGLPKKNWIYGKDYIIEEVKKTKPKKEVKEIKEKETKPEEPQFSKSKVNTGLRESVISKFHSTRDQAETALRQVKDLLLGSYIHQVGDKWKVYAPVQKERSNQFPQQSIEPGQTRSKEDIITKEEGFSIIKDFTNRLGVNAKFITKEEGKKILGERWEDGIKAFYHQGQVYLMHLNLDDVIHEFSHPLVDALAKENINLFSNLMEQIAQEHLDIYDYVEENYPEDFIDGKPTVKAFKEMAVRAITKLAKEDVKVNKSSLQKLWEAIKDIINTLLGKTIDISKLSPNTTLKELASIISSGKVDLKPETSETEFKKEKPKTPEEKKNIQESPFKAQYVFFKRRLAELQTQQREFNEGTPKYNKIQEEIDNITSKLEQANEEQNHDIYKELGESTLSKIEGYIDLLKKGEALTDKNIEFVADVLDTFRDFSGLRDKTDELERELAPVIQNYTRTQVQEHATEKHPITQELIDTQTEDIGKFKQWVGSLSDSPNYIVRTIGSIIKSAQNKIAERDKKSLALVKKEIEGLESWAKKNGVSLEKTYDLFIQSRKGTTGLAQQYYESGELNKNWQKIQDTPELKQFYKFYQDSIEKAQEKLPIKLGKSFIPNIRKSTLKNKIKELVPVKEHTEGEFIGNEELYADILPIQYTKGIKEEEKSRDLGAILLQFQKYSHNYEEMSEILPKVRILQRSLTKKVNSKGAVVDREFINPSDPRNAVKGINSNAYKMVEDVINMQIFGEMKLTQGKIKFAKTFDEEGNITSYKYITSSDIGDVALKYNSLLRIGFSPMTSLANWAFGGVTNTIEAIGGRYFGVRDLINARGIFLKQTLDKNSVLNKILIEDLNILQDLEDYGQIADVALKSKLSPEKLQEYAYSMQKVGEKWIQSGSAMAIMIKDGYLTTSGELTEKYNKSTPKEKQELIAKIHRVNQLMHGRYSQQEAATLQQSIFYRMFIQFKKWIPAAIESRFGDKQYDNRLQAETEGRYNTFYNLAINLKDTIKRLQEGKMTELEIYNMKKNLTDIIILVATGLAYAQLHGDDDKSKKRRRQWAVKTGLALLNRVSGDITSFGPSQLIQTGVNLVPLVKTAQGVLQAVQYLPIAFDHEKGVYKSGSHKGQNKFLTKLGSVTVGVKPIGDIRRLFNKQLLEEQN